MSYCIGIYVKVEGCEKYVMISYPTYYHPTYNLRELFKNCMNWDFKSSSFYRCDTVIELVENGIGNLRNRTFKYAEFLPSNGWGTMEDALETLKSIRECILEENENIPLECMYLKWE